MNKIIKNQIKQLKPSATLAINEESNRLKKSGKKVYKFGFGQSPFPIPETIVSALKNNANKNTYLPMQGLEELRSAVANYLNSNNNNNFKSDDIHNWSRNKGTNVFDTNCFRRRGVTTSTKLGFISTSSLYC